MKILLCAVLAAFVGGCGDDAGSTPVDAAPVVDAAPDAFVLPFTLTGTVEEPGVGSGSGSAIGGASICMRALEGSPCTSTDSTGDYSFVVIPPSVPTNVTEVTTANNHLGAVFVAGWTQVEGSWSSDVTLLPDAAATTLLQTQAGFTYPVTDTGFVEIFVGNGAAGMAAVGATATLSPAAAPVYFDETNTPTPALTSTTSSGRILWGNLAPGIYEITVTAPGKTCTVFTGGHDLPVTSGYFAPTGGATLGVGVVGGALTTDPAVVCD